MNIQLLSFKDLPYVSKIMQERWNVSAEWANEEAKRFLVADKNTAGFCIHNGDKTVGIELFDLYNKDVSRDYGPWLYLLWIDQEYRGHGLGIEITKKIMEHANKYGYKEIYLDTTDALGYHQKFGWRDVCVVNFEGKLDYIMKYDLSKSFPS